MICLTKEQLNNVKESLKKLHQDGVDIQDSLIIFEEFNKVVKDEKVSIDMTERYLKYLVDENIRPFLSLVRKLSEGEKKAEKVINPKYQEIKNQIDELKKRLPQTKSDTEKRYISKEINRNINKLKNIPEKIPKTEAELQEGIKKGLEKNITELKKDLELLRQGKEIPKKEQKEIQTTEEIKKLQQEKQEIQSEISKIKEAKRKIERAEQLEKENTPEKVKEKLQNKLKVNLEKRIRELATRVETIKKTGKVPKENKKENEVELTEELKSLKEDEAILENFIKSARKAENNTQEKIKERLQNRLKSSLVRRIKELETNIALLKDGKEIPKKTTTEVELNDELQTLSEDKASLDILINQLKGEIATESKIKKTEQETEDIRLGKEKEAKELDDKLNENEKKLSDKQKQLNEKLEDLVRIKKTTSFLRDLLNVAVGVELPKGVIDEYVILKKRSEEAITRANELNNEREALIKKIEKNKKENIQDDNLEQEREELENKYKQVIAEMVEVNKSKDEFIKNNNLNLDIYKGWQKFIVTQHSLTLSADFSAFGVQLTSFIFTRNFWKAVNITGGVAKNKENFQKLKAELQADPKYKEYVDLGGISTIGDPGLGFQQDLQNNPYFEVEFDKTLFGKYLGGSLDWVLKKSSETFSAPIEYVRFQQYKAQTDLMEASGVFEDISEEEVLKIKEAVAKLINLYSGSSKALDITVDSITNKAKTKEELLEKQKATNLFLIILTTSLRKKVANFIVGFRPALVIPRIVKIMSKNPNLIKELSPVGNIKNVRGLSSEEINTLYEWKRLASLFMFFHIMKLLASNLEDQEWNPLKPGYYVLIWNTFFDDEGKEKQKVGDPVGGNFILPQILASAFSYILGSYDVEGFEDYNTFGKGIDNIIDKVIAGRKGLLLGGLIQSIQYDIPKYNKELEGEESNLEIALYSLAILLKGQAPVPLSLSQIGDIPQTEGEEREDWVNRIPVSILTTLLNVIGIGSYNTKPIKEEEE